MEKVGSRVGLAVGSMAVVGSMAKWSESSIHNWPPSGWNISAESHLHLNKLLHTSPWEICTVGRMHHSIN